MRNKIYTIVEGYGEARSNKTKPAAVMLIQKLLAEVNCDHLFPAEKYPPFRLPYGQFFRDDKFERAIRLHKKYPDCAAILALLDMDDDCAKEQALILANRVRKMETLPFSVVIVCAVREYESWFLASLESIQLGNHYQGNAETIRDAKGWLRRNFGYKQTQDQAIYTQKLDATLAYERTRSFRRLYHAFEEIKQAAESNLQTITPSL